MRTRLVFSLVFFLKEIFHFCIFLLGTGNKFELAGQFIAKRKLNSHSLGTHCERRLIGNWFTNKNMICYSIETQGGNAFSPSLESKWKVIEKIE